MRYAGKLSSSLAAPTPSLVAQPGGWVAQPSSLQLAVNTWVRRGVGLASQVLARSLKRGAKILAHEAISVSGIIERELTQSRRDMVLMYHAVETERSGYPYSVSQFNLEKQIRFLRQYFKIVPLDEILSTTANESRVAFTFDDAYEDLYVRAYPLLQRYQVPATIFIPTAYVGKSSSLMHDKIFGCAKRHLTWGQIREMQESGLIAFESHSHRHYSAVECIDVLRQDVLTSIQVLQDNIGYTPRYFAYPYGACNAETHAIVLACGFKKLLTVEPHVVGSQLTVGRFDVNRHNERLAHFKMTVAGLNVRSWMHQARWRTQTGRSAAQAEAVH